VAGCISQSTGDGSKNKINTNFKDKDFANIYFKYSSSPAVYGYPPKIKINNNKEFILGDNESIEIKIKEGQLDVDISPTYPLANNNLRYRTFNKNFKKKLVEKNNNYFFIIKPGKFSVTSEDLKSGILPTPDYTLDETFEEAFHDFQNRQLGTSYGSKVPTIHSFDLSMFSIEILKEINFSEENFKTKLELDLKESIFKSENECIKNNLKKEIEQFRKCIYQVWSTKYGKEYLNLINEISKENSRLKELVNKSSNNQLIQINSNRQAVIDEKLPFLKPAYLETVDNSNNFLGAVIGLVASYYLGKALGEVLGPNQNTKMISQSSSNNMGIKYICFLNYGGGGCSPGSGYGFVR
jgi:hypothetical protein